MFTLSEQSQMELYETIWFHIKEEKNHKQAMEKVLNNFLLRRLNLSDKRFLCQALFADELGLVSHNEELQLFREALEFQINMVEHRAFLQ